MKDNKDSNRVIRLRVHRYMKSKKLTCFDHTMPAWGIIAVDLSSDMRSVSSVRQLKYVKRDSLENTEFEVEFKRRVDGDTFQYRYLRVLSPQDTDPERWKNTKSLSDLPVSVYEPVTEEEKLWAGMVIGNTGEMFCLYGATLVSFYFLCNALFSGVWISFSLFIFPILLRFCFAMKWIKPQKPDVKKLEELSRYKKALIRNNEMSLARTKTQFSEALCSYENWEAMSPEAFESSIAFLLNQEGMDVRVTAFSNDGGVDIKGKDSLGMPVVIQVKQYKGNVGVSVVREMIGVREFLGGDVRVIIFSLVGFTRGAIELAKSNGVELRNVRSEVLFNAL